MNRRAWINRLKGVGPRVAQGILAAALLALIGLLGCTSLQPRFQSEDDVDHYYVETIGDKTMVGNAAPIAVGGVGLVTGLEGTGGDCPPDTYRAILENDLQKQKIRNYKALLTSPNNAVVLISGQIQPGASKGDRIDLEVDLPRGSRATSLRGGYLCKCKLFNYDFAERLNPDPNGPRGMLRGYPIVEAEGLLLVGLSNGNEATQVKHGRIWSGGRCLTSASFSLLLHPNQQFGRVSAEIADRINEAFQTSFHGDASTAVAEAQRNLGVKLRVPPQYRLNTPRFLRVVRLIPMTNQIDAPSGKGDDHRTYRQKLADDLLDPARTVSAALRLEALGQISKPALKKGLDPRHHPLVRFCSAEALAYLGDPICGDELAAAVAKQPALRAFGLTAMASLDEAICQVKLAELVTTAPDDETRYGAFRALRALNPRHELARGELLNESFWLHRVASRVTPMVHISSTRRAEIVLFGEEPTLKPDFGFSAGEYVVAASKDDDHCVISRVPLYGPTTRKNCPLKLSKVLHALADMGGCYPEAIAILQQAESAGVLSCRVRCDALPQAVSVQELAKLGREKPGQATLDVELVPAGQDLGVTPTLFDNGLSTFSSRARQQQVLLDDGKSPKSKRGTDAQQ
jgi:hypothetical protein